MEQSMSPEGMSEAEGFEIQLSRQFQDLLPGDQAGIYELLRKLTIRGFGHQTLADAAKEVVHDHNFFSSPNNRDNRLIHFESIASSQEVSGITVEKAKEILGRKTSGWCTND